MECCEGAGVDRGAVGGAWLERAVWERRWGPGLGARRGAGRGS